MQPFIQNDNTITQLKAGGFNLIRNEKVVDSINMVYNFYRGVKFVNDYNLTCYWDIARKAQELMDLPPPPATIEENIPKHFLQNKEIFIQYDKPRDTSALQYDRQCKRKLSDYNSIGKAIQRKS